MKPILLGLVAVPTAGTPVPITAALIAAAWLANGYSANPLPPTGCVCKIEISPRAANVGVVTVKGKTNNAPIRPLLVPASGYSDTWCAESDGNTISPTDFSIDAAANNDGAYVILWVK